MSAFNPPMLTLARRRRGLNKSALAKLVEVTPKSIGDYENGKTTPATETMERLARALRFPLAFFETLDFETPNADAVSFRAMTSVTAAQRDAALGAGALAIALSAWIEDRFAVPECDLPDLRSLSPENAAAAVREAWGLGVKPIRNMVHLLEFHGARVFSLTENSRELDAFSLWHGTKPFCFLNTMKSVEHGRMDAAHELGHLVLHKDRFDRKRDYEHQANEFASALLMPASTVLAAVPRGITLSTLVKLKKAWGVSVAALAHRVHKVGVISDWQYRSFCIEMSTLGWRTSEPDPIESRETSQVLNKVFTALRSDGISKADVARELKIHTHDLDAIVFGLAITGLSGGNASSNRKPSTPNLKLITS